MATAAITRPIARTRPSALASAWRRLSRGDKLALIAFGVVLLVGLVGPFFAPHSRVTPVGQPFSPPGHGTLLGTDDVGRDILSRLLYGVRLSWLGALAVIAVGATFGTLVGLVAGASGGIVDAVLMRTTDAFLALPAVLLAIAVGAAIGPSYFHTLVAVAVIWWPVYARLVRGQVAALARRPHVEAARVSGVSKRRIWFRHLLPGAVAPVVIAASLDVGTLVLVLASLAFLGLGSPDPATELGTMTSAGVPFILSSPWVCLVPALAVFIIAFTSNVAGDALSTLVGTEE